MKPLITILFVLLISMQSFGQKKGKVDPEQLLVDSLTLVTKGLTLQLDSVTVELNKYLGVYTTLTEEVFKYNFDPARTSFLIDSLQDNTRFHLHPCFRCPGGQPDIDDRQESSASGKVRQSGNWFRSGCRPGLG